MALLHNQTIIGAESMVSVSNSTDTPLAAGATWTGLGESISGYISVAVSITTDQPGTCHLLYSPNGEHWDFDIVANVVLGQPMPRIVTSGIRAPWVKVTFTNTSGSPQTYLRLQTMYNPSAVDTGSSRVSDGFSNAALAETVKSAVFGTRDDGATTGIKFDNFNQLKTTANVANFPNPQPVSGTISVSNFPATYSVTGAFWQATQPISGTITALPSTTATNGWSTGTLSTSTTTADQTIVSYTVPNGKTLLLNGADVSCIATGILGNILALVTVQNLGLTSLVIDGTKIWTGQLAGLTQDRDRTQSVANPIPVPAGLIVKIVCTPGITTLLRWIGNIEGVLV